MYLSQYAGQLHIIQIIHKNTEAPIYENSTDFFKFDR